MTLTFYISTTIVILLWRWCNNHPSKVSLFLVIIWIAALGIMLSSGMAVLFERYHG